ncbi:hypothetical protein [Helicobacter sp. 23-1045]
MKELIKKSLIFRVLNPLRLAILRMWEKRLSDEEYFKKRHQKIFGYTPDFAHPKTFNEKIIHRILFDRNPLYTHLADKLKARIYIAYKLRDFAFEGGGR